MDFWRGDPVKIGLVQMRSGTEITANIAAMEGLVRDAAGKGASYIQTPEMTGILQKSKKGLFEQICEPSQDPLLGVASRLAEDLSVWLHIGSHAVRVSDELAANRAFVFSPRGELIVTYDKIHMFDVDLDHGESWRESKVYRPGTSGRLVSVDGFNLGLSICYDIRFPQLYRRYAQTGAEVLAAPAAFTRQTGAAHWHVLMRARAIENGAFVVAAAQGGNHEDGRETFGHSLIVNPWGEIICELPHDEPGCAVASIDLSEVTAARNKVPNLINGRDFSVENASAETGSAA